MSTSAGRLVARTAPARAARGIPAIPARARVLPSRRHSISSANPALALAPCVALALARDIAQSGLNAALIEQARAHLIVSVLAPSSWRSRNATSCTRCVHPIVVAQSSPIRRILLHATCHRLPACLALWRAHAAHTFEFVHAAVRACHRYIQPIGTRIGPRARRREAARLFRLPAASGLLQDGAYRYN